MCIYSFQFLSRSQAVAREADRAANDVRYGIAAERCLEIIAMGSVVTLTVWSGYCRRGKFGGAVVYSMFLMYSLDGVDDYRSRGGEFQGMESV